MFLLGQCFSEKALGFMISNQIESKFGGIDLQVNLLRLIDVISQKKS